MSALGRLRGICLSFPGAWEKVSHGEPTFWVGKLGGTVKSTGRFIDVAGNNNWNQMLTTVARAMGVTVDKVGDLGSPGIIPNLIS